MIHLAAAKASPFREAPHSSMYGASSRIIFSNCGKSSDCAPSLMAFSGAGCTSTINPSAPIATPARESAGSDLASVLAGSGKTPQFLAPIQDNIDLHGLSRFTALLMNEETSAV